MNYVVMLTDWADEDPSRVMAKQETVGLLQPP